MAGIVVTLWCGLRLFVRRLGSLAVVSALAIAVTGCEFTCDPVTTQEKAFEISKQRLIEGHMTKIKQLGGDASIFEDSELGDFGTPCDRPARFHYARHLYPNQAGEWFEVIWVGFVKGKCEGCWDTITLATVVTRCGGFYVFASHREPNRNYIVLRPDQLAKGESGLRYTSYCGPRRGTPLPD